MFPVLYDRQAARNIPCLPDRIEQVYERRPQEPRERHGAAEGDLRDPGVYRANVKLQAAHRASGEAQAPQRSPEFPHVDLPLREPLLQPSADPIRPRLRDAHRDAGRIEGVADPASAHPAARFPYEGGIPSTANNTKTKRNGLSKYWPRAKKAPPSEKTNPQMGSASPRAYWTSPHTNAANRPRQ